jgi:hypothetical protein
MGEAKRKRDLASLKSNLDIMHKEGQGVWSLDIIPLEMATAAMFGLLDADDKKLSEIIHMATTVFKSMQHEKIQCLTCDHEFSIQQGAPAAFCMIKGHNPAATRGQISILCAACVSRPDIKDRILNTLRSEMLSDLREIQISEGTGNA